MQNAIEAPKFTCKRVSDQMQQLLLWLWHTEIHKLEGATVPAEGQARQDGL